ncbi:MAG: mucus-binding protein, partial [Lactobacillus sp.]|nr:mucus-binding protein [Lactobacillus sp.]
VLLGTTLWLGNNANVAKADTNPDKGNVDNVNEEAKASIQSGAANAKKAVIVANSNPESSSADKTAKDPNVASEAPKTSQEQSVQSSTDTSQYKDSKKSANVVSTDKNVNENLKKGTDIQVENGAKNTQIKQAEQSTQQSVTKKATENINSAVQSGKQTGTNTVSQDLNKAAQEGKNESSDQLTKSGVNLTTKDQFTSAPAVGYPKVRNNQTDKTQDVKLNDISSGLAPEALKTNLTKGNQVLVNRATVDTLFAQNKTIDPSKELAATKIAQLGLNLIATPTTASDNDTVTVKDWNGLQSAVNSGKQVTIDGNIVAQNSLNIYGNASISGTNGSTLTLGQYAINNNNTLTLKDINVLGSIMGNGTVNIEGTVTSTVNDINGYTLTNSEKTPGVKTNWGQTKGFNIEANAVNIKDGASLTVNRASIGDGIHLVNSNSLVKVGDNAHLTVNMNTNNDLNTTARYHDAGVFAESTGSFTTGRNSEVNFNTSIGQAIAMAGMRPNVTDSDRFGGYGTRNRPNGSGQINLGQYSTLNFTGRDGVILGNNSNFNVDEYANVHFENKGRGVALDLANQSNINVGNHAVTFFHSVDKNTTNALGNKVGPSGSYDGYNYIGVNEAGNITIGEDATFRVIMQNRGDNAWDDVVSLDSQDSTTNAAFTSKKGAIVDIRDDNTNFYAELISFPLGNPNSRIDIQDPLLLNLQRYSAGGATTGWMAGVGGTDINSTSDKYTANLIYMGGTKGILTIGGTDYVVYQQIKSDGAQQIWTDVNSVQFNKHGFASADVYNNGANPDLSISGEGLTPNIRANQIRDNQTSPTQAGLQNTPAYGISTMRASHQIWIPHETNTQIKGSQSNTIKYVYEDGSPVLGKNGQPLVVTQDLNLTRDLTLNLTDSQIKSVQDYALNHTVDEVLDYIRSGYAVTKDSGWIIKNGAGQIVTDPYAAVKSPVEQGYTATIQSTNAPGVIVGADGSIVKANFTLNAAEDVVQNGMLSEGYRTKGITGIPNDYETVVVYKKADTPQPTDKGSVQVIYHDDTTDTTIPDVGYNSGEKAAGTAVTYTTTATIQDLENKGYVYVKTDGTIPAQIEADKNIVVTVHMKHGTTTVTPDKPGEPGQPINPNDPDGPKWPDNTGKDNLEKTGTQTIHYEGAGDKTPADNKQDFTFTKNMVVDKVTGKVITDNPWTPSEHTFGTVKTPVVEGYHADKANAGGTTITPDDLNKTVVVTYSPNGKIVPVDPTGEPIPDAPTPQYPTNPDNPTEVTPNEPVPTIPGYTPEVPSVTPTDPGKDTPVVYTPDKAKKGSVQVIYHDDTTDTTIPDVGYNSGEKAAGTAV